MLKTIHLSYGVSIDLRFSSVLPSRREQEQHRHWTIDLGISFKISEKFSEERMQYGPEVVSFDSMPEAGFPDAGNNVAGLAASVLVPLLNQNMVNHDISSREATFIEMEVVHWIRAALGYSVAPTYSMASEIGGILILGGCLSNTIALVAARERLFPGSGLRGPPARSAFWYPKSSSTI